MPDRWTLAEADLLPLSLGAALLGTGGGGNPYVGMLRARQLVRGGAVLEVLPLDLLADDAWVGEVGGIGAPVVGIEKIEEGGECLRALRAAEEASARPVSALISAEIGGANAIEPLIVAAQAGLPVVDGDGMGRAFPEVQMSTFMIYGADPSPAAIADDKGNVVVLRHMRDARWLERFARDAAVAMGATAGFATAPMRGDFVRRAAVPGTVGQALAIGRAILDARARRRDVVDRVCRDTGARVLFAGKLVDVARRLEGGFARGHALVSGSSDWAGRQARVAIQNEFLVLWIDGAVVATVPDLIMIVEEETGEPITTEVLRYGQRVVVLGLPAHPLLRSPEAMAVIGPAAFGYPDIPFTPVA